MRRNLYFSPLLDRSSGRFRVLRVQIRRLVGLEYTINFQAMNTASVFRLFLVKAALAESLLPLLAPLALSVRAATPVLPFLSPIFGDHMVLQRGKPSLLWGRAKPNERMRVSIGERAKSK